MANIILRSLSVGLSTGATTKNGPLTNLEGDANFNNLNAEKLERNGSIQMTGTLRLTANQLPALRFAQIVDPSSLQDGDVWCDTDGMLKYHFNGTTHLLFNSMNLVGTANRVILTNVGNVVTLSTPQDIATTSSPRFRSLGVGMAAPATEGRIDASNDVVAFSTSDMRFKTNITPIIDPLKMLQEIRGVKFTWDAATKDIHGYDGQSVGVLAQDVRAVLPEAVRERENGYLAVDYTKLIPVLIEAIAQLQDEVETLRMTSVV
jgi:hypothetical protein